MTEPYKIFGGPGSPYSHKVRSVFRYRRIRHTWAVPRGEFSGGGTLGSDAAVGKEVTDLQKAAKGVVPVVKFPDGSYKADSTPLIYELEKRHEGRSVIPPDKGLAFLSHLIEDMADEFLPMPMFFYRWTDDQVWCGRRQMAGWLGAVNDDVLDAAAQSFLDRQAGQLAGARTLDPERMKLAYDSFLEVMEEQLRHNLFLFGSRPSLADFGIYGQLTQYAVDPKVCNWMKDKAVRTYQWVHLVDDLSGVEGNWFEPDEVLNERLEGFLSYVAEFYLPMAELLTQVAGTDDLEGLANGMKYRVKTFLGLKAELAALAPADVATIKPILEKTGCWEALQFKDGEATKVVAIELL
jgi:glutathione S-transferase